MRRLGSRQERISDRLPTQIHRTSEKDRLTTRHVPRSQKDPGSWILRIQDPGSWEILDLTFSFSLGILQILGPVMATMPGDPRDIGSRTGRILLDPGSSLSKSSWDLADLGSYLTIIPLYFEHPLHQVKFCFWFPISMGCLNMSIV